MLFISDQVHHFKSQIAFDNAEEVLDIENIKISLDLFDNKINVPKPKPAWP
jgi:hypothetical protein